MLGLKNFISPQNLIKIIKAIFEKIEIFPHLNYVPLNKGSRKRKNKHEIFAREPCIQNLNEIDQMV